MKLLTKLLEIQKAVDVFVKNEKGLNYNYASGDQVLHKIRPLMNEKGLLLKQEILSHENQVIQYTTNNGKDKQEVLTSASQKFTWIDTESNEREECLFAGNGFNDYDKGLGSALTYAERYFLLKFFHVPTDGDDPDKRQGYNGGAAKKDYPEDNRPWLSEKQLTALKAKIDKGETEVYEKAEKAFRMKKTYREELKNYKTVTA